MVSFEHFKISTHMVCQCDRLRFLQMGKSRHDRLGVVLHDRKKFAEHIHNQSLQCGDLTSCIKLHIQCNLVITASSGMQLLPCIPDPVDQICLYKTVDIFVFLCNLKLSTLYIPADAFQSVQNLLLLIVCQDPLLCKHHNMRLAALDILLIKSFIK